MHFGAGSARENRAPADASLAHTPPDQAVLPSLQRGSGEFYPQDGLSAVFRTDACGPIAFAALTQQARVAVSAPPAPPPPPAMVLVLRGGDGADTLTGGAGPEDIYGVGGDDQLFGNGGDDYLSGGEGRDLLDGGDGNDLIVSGPGGDIMRGGAGADIFFISRSDNFDTSTRFETEVIQDFNAREDILYLYDYRPDQVTFDAATTSFQFDGGHSLIVVGDFSGVTDLSQWVVFDAPPPLPVAPAMPAAGVPSQATTTTTSDVIIESGETRFVAGDEPDVVGYRSPLNSLNSLDNYGSLLVSGSGAGVGANAVGARDLELRNHAGARLFVEATGQDATARGVYLWSSMLDGDIRNDGDFTVVSRRGDAVGVWTSAGNDFFDFTNTGNFLVQGRGIATGLMPNFDSASFDNSGVFEVRGLTAYGIRGIGGYLTAFNNTGVIKVDDGQYMQNSIAVWVDAIFTTATNSGVIEADIAFLINADVATEIANVGTIRGDIYLWSGNDLIVNTGGITGLIDLAAGADRYDGRGGGALYGAVYGGSGDDELLGGSGAEIFNGEDGDDILSGGAGDDVLNGGRGDDMIDGGLGDDRFDGGDGHDVLIVTGDFSQYRLLLNGDDFVLKGPDGGDVLTRVENIRFGDGRVLELNRMYALASDVWADGRIPEALLSEGAKGGAQPLVLPGSSDVPLWSGNIDQGPQILPQPSSEDVDGFLILPAVPDGQPLVLPRLETLEDTDQPLVLPGAEDPTPLFLALDARLDVSRDWIRAIDSEIAPRLDDWI